jgi:hypothetical protein
MFGNPGNFDTAAGERMHKETAKKPGRAAKKDHKTFTLASAHELADRLMVNTIDNLIGSADDNDGDKEKAKPIGRSFTFKFTPDEVDPSKVNVNVMQSNCEHELNNSPPLNEMSFDVICMLTKNCYDKNDPSTHMLKISTEYVNDDNVTYRCHWAFRNGKPWHDWCYITKNDKAIQDKETLIPVKLMCMLPNGYKDKQEPHAVCQLTSDELDQSSALITAFTVLQYNNRNQQIRDQPTLAIVPCSSLCQHCLVVTDTVNPSIVYMIKEKNEWAKHFIANF